MKGRTIPQEVTQGSISLTVVFSREVQPLPHCGLAGLEQREEMPQLLSLIPPISSWYPPRPPPWAEPTQIPRAEPGDETHGYQPPRAQSWQQGGEGQRMGPRDNWRMTSTLLLQRPAGRYSFLSVLLRLSDRKMTPS